ncbi:MAG: hypothetical protein JST70_09200 [Bacteroidetes bacterium]|nr:hypothetical protein [Bacteroidota bacterium]
MNRLVILPLAIIACCLYSCSPKIGESTSSSDNNSNTIISSSPATQTNTATNISSTTTKPNNNVKEVSGNNVNQDKVASFPANNGE